MHPVIQEIQKQRKFFPELWEIRFEERGLPLGSEAEAAVLGRLYFYGKRYRKTSVYVGTSGIDWSGGQVKHQEWPAYLNRFDYLWPLACQYASTGKEKYARAARNYIQDWLTSHDPYPADGGCLPGDSSLNMAIRLGTTGHWPGWLKVLEVFAPSPAFNHDFVESVLAGAEWQLNWLRWHLSGTGNWRIAGLWCLLSAALVIPSRFSHFGPPAAADLVTEFYSQILPDGVHLERSAGYHQWMSHSFLLLQKIGERLSPKVSLEKKRVVAMDLFALAHTRPDGQPCRFNDSSSSLEESHPEVLTSRLVAHRRLRQWLGIRKPVALDAVFPEAGLAFFRTGWGADAAWLAFDASTDFPGPHGHLSRLSFEFHYRGRTLIPDPGIFSYEMSSWKGAAGRKTVAHATACVDLLNQADVAAQLLAVYASRHIALVHGRYSGGYWTGRYEWIFPRGRGQGLWGFHDRVLVWFKERCLLVIDTVSTEPGHTIYLNYPLQPGPCQVKASQSEAWTKHPEVNVWMKVVPLGKTGQPSVKLYCGDRKAELGFLGVGF
ncbi:MAG TPA: heparinase II/III family protein, partial [bacterium]|nr:heparinase II/III family protein [bacterium]